MWWQTGQIAPSRTLNTFGVISGIRNFFHGLLYHKISAGKGLFAVVTIYICIHVNMFVPSSVSSPVLPYSGVSASHRQVYVSWHSQPDFVALAVRSIAQVALKMTSVLRCPAGINGPTTGVGKWGKASYKIREQICIYNIIEPFREQIGFKQTPSNFVQQDIQNFNCQEEDVEPTRLLLPTKIDDGDKISTGANQG